MEFVLALQTSNSQILLSLFKSILDFVSLIYNLIGKLLSGKANGHEKLLAPQATQEKLLSWMT